MLSSQVKQPKNPSFLQRIWTQLMRAIHWFKSIWNGTSRTRTPTVEKDTLNDEPDEPISLPQEKIIIPTVPVSAAVDIPIRETFGAPLPLWENPPTAATKANEDPFTVLSEQCWARLGIRLDAFPVPGDIFRSLFCKADSTSYGQTLIQLEAFNGYNFARGTTQSGQPFVSYVYQIEGSEEPRIVTIFARDKDIVYKDQSLIRICNSGYKEEHGQVYIEEVLDELWAISAPNREALDSVLQETHHISIKGVRDIIADYLSPSTKKQP